MASDRQGLAVSGSAESASALDSAVTDYYALRGDPIATLQLAAQTDPSFVLGPAAIVSPLALNGTLGDDPRVSCSARTRRGCGSLRVIAGTAPSRSSASLEVRSYTRANSSSSF
jgi:hypothetical protein